MALTANVDDVAPRAAVPSLGELRLAAQRAASRRRRRLALRRLVRVSVLLALDTGVVLGAWQLLKLLRADVRWVAILFPPGLLGGRAFAVTVLVGLIAAGAYRAGDRWSSWGTVSTGVAVGSAVALWSDLWTTGAYAAIGRLVVATLVLGSFVGLGRSATFQLLAMWRARIGLSEPVVLAGLKEDLPLFQGPPIPIPIPVSAARHSLLRGAVEPRRAFGAPS